MAIDIYYYSIGDHGYLPDIPKKVQVLDEAELKRYHRFKFDKDRWRFLSARYLLKEELARRLNTVPEEVRFFYNPNGKPYLAGGELHFNLSHCQQAIAYVVSAQPAGIDIEAYDHRTDPWNSPANYLHESIAQHITRCSTSDAKKIMFYRYWSCMEALVKLKGATLFSVKSTFGAEGLDIPDDGQYHYDGDILFTRALMAREQLSLAYSRDAELNFFFFDGRDFIEQAGG